MTNSQSLSDRCLQILRSPRFGWAIVGLLIVQALWVALSARYPMAFDEDFHLGVIRLYADQLSPFLGDQPAGAEAYGAVARDPSYFYHYLMSFPYRVIELFSQSTMVQVLLLRMINIGLFAWGLVLYRRLLLKTGASAALIHLVLLVVVLIPVVPLLTAQINYDNLIFPLTAIVMLLALKLTSSKPKIIHLPTLLGLLSLGLAASLVKYAFLPILAVVLAFVIWRFWQNYQTLVKLKSAFKAGWQRCSKLAVTLLAVTLLIASGLFMERFGVNLWRYHEPVPACGQVLSYEQCQHYGPWIRDYRLEQAKPDTASSNPLHFTREWVHGMWFRSFFAVDGPTTRFQTHAPLTLPAVSVAVLGVVSLLVFPFTARQIWRRYQAPALWLLSSASVIYIAALWWDVYKRFLATGVPVAINGRYLIPVLPFLILLAALAIRELTAGRRHLQLVIASVSILCLLWGGGTLTYILRSREAWYWPNTPLKSVNLNLQRNLGPLTPGYYNLHQFAPQ